MKKMRAVIASLLACATLISFAGCARVKLIDDEDVFFDALDNAVGIDEDETQHAKGTTFNGDKAEYVIQAKDGDNTYIYVRFKKAEDAMNYFEDAYDSFSDTVKDKDFDGSHSMAISKKTGSITFNGDIEKGSKVGTKYLSKDSEIFGGVYVNQNVYIEVYSIEGSKRDKEKISSFLKELGFPKP